MRYSLPILLVGLLLGGCDASSPEGGNDDRNEDESTSDLTVTAQWSETHQTIRGFGASDAWTVQSLGDWPADKKNRMADLLFSQETDANEDPKGIGLSIWRFNIGAGSAEQGQASGIDNSQRRVKYRDYAPTEDPRHAGPGPDLAALRHPRIERPGTGSGPGAGLRGRARRRVHASAPLHRHVCRLLVSESTPHDKSCREIGKPKL